MIANESSSIDSAEIYNQLEQVTDPELDRPLTELGFIDDVLIDGADITVDLRLPTGMCSPVFAWMMARDAKNEIRSLDNVGQVTVNLEDHLFAEQITMGINDDRAFDDVFEDAETGPEHVRRKLDWKACLAREYEVIEEFRQKDISPEETVHIERGDVNIEDTATVVLLKGKTVEFQSDIIHDYLQKAEEFDISTEPANRLLVDSNGEPIDVNSFDQVRRRLRAAHVNKENQGHHCEQLLESRYNTEQENTRTTQ